MNSPAAAASTTTGGRAILSPFRPVLKPSPLPQTLRFRSNPGLSRPVSATSATSPSPIKSTATGVLILSAAAAALLAAKFPIPPALAEPSEAAVSSEAPAQTQPLASLLDSNPDALPALRTLLYKKLDDGDDSAALSILRRLIAAHPSETEWKFLAARLLNETGDTDESRKLFEEILAADPLSFEALFENAVLMDRCGEGPAVIERLERALDLARAEGKGKAARDVRLIMAQIQFLQKNVEEALASYEELAAEDPKDYRPYFCQGVIYSLLERNKEAREKFAKYHELSPKKFEVDAYLQTPLSRMKLFGTEDSEI